jgi:hypothetical protein
VKQPLWEVIIFEDVGAEEHPYCLRASVGDNINDRPDSGGDPGIVRGRGLACSGERWQVMGRDHER